MQAGNIRSIRSGAVTLVAIRRIALVRKYSSGVAEMSYASDSPNVLKCARAPYSTSFRHCVSPSDQSAALGAPSTFGGVIPTPTMDRIAREGPRFTNFHSTSLCSPTRAAIITGRNHHSVGFGVVGEIATGFPGYDSIIPIEKGTVGTILKENGYGTAWFGKDHNTPSYQSSQAGPV
jgi:hypothetical protein